MSEQHRKRESTVVVEDLDATMSAAQTRPVPSAPAEDREEAHTNITQLLGREVYTWTSPFQPDQPVVVRFRRPPGGTREMVARVLGSAQSDNTTLFREYLALASVIEVNGERISQPKTTMTFAGLKKRIGWVGPGEEDWFDEPVVTFTFAYECAMYPDQLRAYADLEGAGLSPDDEKRILKNAGLERPKV